MSRAHTDRLRAARRAVTGHKLGTIKTLWDARPGHAAGPDPTPTQAALEAWLLHVSYGFGLMNHPLGYEGLRDQRWLTNSWLTPHADQLVIECSAPNNWIGPFVDWTQQDADVSEAGGSQLVAGYDQDTRTGWLIGPGGTAIVFVWYGRIELEKRPLPAHLAGFVDEHPPVLREHPTDRLLSALVRRFLITDFYLSPHDFFSFDGHLGIELGQGSPRDGVRSHEPAQGLGFSTAGELIEACLTDHFLGIPDVLVAERNRSWTALEDKRNGARLLLSWRRP